MPRRVVVVGLAMLLCAGCVSVPTGPTVTVMPGPDKSFVREGQRYPAGGTAGATASAALNLGRAATSAAALVLSEGKRLHSRS